MMMSRSETIKVNEDDRVLTSSTSKGNQTKWFKGGYWIKANQFGYEDISEATASLVLGCSTLVPNRDFVNYRLCTIVEEDTGLVYDGCYSKNFLPSDYSLVTLQRILERFGADFSVISGNKYSTEQRIKYVIEFVHKNTGLDITGYLRCIITLDSFILNEDRHLNNIAFLYNRGLFGFAPIFDNGLSLLSDVKDYPNSSPLEKNIRKVGSRTFSSSFKKQLDVLGVGFKVNGTLLEEKLESSKYNLGRAYRVLKYQMVKYKGVIVV